MAETLWLKWGTLKGWNLETDDSRGAVRAYLNLGISAGAITVKEALCTLIDAVAASGGTIINEWTGKEMKPDDAKDYVREYDA